MNRPLFPGLVITDRSPAIYIGPAAPADLGRKIDGLAIGAVAPEVEPASPLATARPVEYLGRAAPLSSPQP